MALPAVPGWAEPPAITLDREGAVYEPGEEIMFTITTAEPATRHGRLEWKAVLNGTTEIKKEGVRLKGGETTVTITANEPGFITFTAETNPDTRLSRPQKEKAAIVAAVAPEQLKPGAPAPDDFDDYWTAQKEALTSVPMEAKLAPVKSKDAKIALFDVTVDCFGGKPVTGYYARPDGAAEKSLPAILLLQSAGVREASKDRAAAWAGKNMLAFDINAYGIPNGQPKAFYQELSKGELDRYPHQGSDSRDSYYFNSVFLRLIRAIDFLTAQPEWDGRTIIAYGYSQGGAQAIAAAALDSRVTFYAAGVPALCDLSADLAGRTPGWPSGLLPKSSAQRTIVRDVVKYYDMASFAPRVKAPGIVSVGFLDTVCAPSSVYAAYNVLGGEKQIVQEPNSAHTVGPDAVKAFEDAVQAHLNR